MKLCEKINCTGCLACYNACQTNAIIIKTDEEGFYVPIIDDILCIECGKCSKVCPILNPLNKEEYCDRKSYASWSKDKYIRNESSSGGLFTELAKVVISKNGKVFGAAFSSNFTVIHKMVDNKESLNELRGSKYIQSYIGNIYSQINHLLNSNILVLFVGTPCQVAGLKAIVGRNHKKLITIDLICHGTPSTLFFNKYKDWLEIKYDSKIKDYKFRDKRKSWKWFNIKASFISGKVYYGSWFKDPFLRAFLTDYTLRPSCYNCLFTQTYRQGDITLADFWGFKKTCKEEKNSDKGISLVLTNTKKGDELFQETKQFLQSFEHPIDEVLKIQRSLHSSWPMPNDRADFWKDFSTSDFEQCIAKWMKPQKRDFPDFLLSSFGKNHLVDFSSFMYYKFLGARKRAYKLLKFRQFNEI